MRFLDMNVNADMFRRAFNKGDFWQKLFCFFLMLTGYSNHGLQALQIRYKNYRKLCKKYAPLLERVPYEATPGRKNTDDIWICWFQGAEQAPPIVKSCLASVERHTPGKRVHLLDNANIGEYVSFPPWIAEKRARGLIPDAHFSDLLRTELLVRYGGLWLDATVFLTDELPDYVYSNNLFLYRHIFSGDVTISYNSWLIYADSGHGVLKYVRNLLYEYWKKEKHLKEYFLWHMFLTMIFKKYPEHFQGVPYISDLPPEMLMDVCNCPFDADYWRELNKITVVHKLSHKHIPPETVRGTYCDYIIRSSFHDEIPLSAEEYPHSVD